MDRSTNRSRNTWKNKTKFINTPTTPPVFCSFRGKEWARFNPGQFPEEGLVSISIYQQARTRSSPLHSARYFLRRISVVPRPRARLYVRVPRLQRTRAHAPRQRDQVEGEWRAWQTAQVGRARPAPTIVVRSRPPIFARRSKMRRWRNSIDQTRVMLYVPPRKSGSLPSSLFLPIPSFFTPPMIRSDA